jgi:hypothetical protein
MYVANRPIMWIASSWTARGHSLTVGFIEAGESPVREKSLAGKTAERKEARRWDEEASFRDVGLPSCLSTSPQHV